MYNSVAHRSLSNIKPCIPSDCNMEGFSTQACFHTQLTQLVCLILLILLNGTFVQRREMLDGQT